MTAAIILAAGASVRMGTPKALLAFRGGNFLSHLSDRLAATCEPVIVVLGAYADRIVSPLGTTVALNTDWARGQLSSLQCGLRAVPHGAHNILFTLVDHPDPSAVTISRLIHSTAPVAVPVHEGRNGHPVHFGSALVQEFLSLPQDASAKEVFRRYAGSTEYINVDDPGILDDIDDPAALARFRLRTEHA